LERHGPGERGDIAIIDDANGDVPFFGDFEEDVFDVIGEEFIGDATEKRGGADFAIDVNSGGGTSDGIDRRKVGGGTTDTIDDARTMVSGVAFEVGIPGDFV
jgi:hypothetical protein